MRYNSPETPLEKLRRFVRRSGFPFVVSLILINAVMVIVSFFLPELAQTFVPRLLFVPTAWSRAPWTLVTYPLVVTDLVQFLWGALLLWFCAGSLERSWGTQRFIGFFMAISAVSAISLAAGATLLHQETLLMGPWMPGAGSLVAFCMLNPEQSIILYFFPVRAKYVALITVAFTWYMFGRFLGIFACGGLLASYLYVQYGRSWASVGSYRGSPRGGETKVFHIDQARRRRETAYPDGSRKRGPLDINGRIQDWRERRRLEALFKNSGLTDREPDWRDDEGRRR